MCCHVLVCGVARCCVVITNTLIALTKKKTKTQKNEGGVNIYIGVMVRVGVCCCVMVL